MEYGELIFTAVFLATLVYGAFATSAAQKTEWKETSRKLSEKYQLRIVQSGHRHLEGITEQGFRVRVDRSRVVLEGGDLYQMRGFSFHKDVSIFGTGNRDVQLGAKAFDEAVEMTLPNQTKGLALLSPRMRSLLVSCTQSGGGFVDGRLVFRLGTDSLPDFSEIDSAVQSALELADLLVEAHKDPVSNLLEIAQEDRYEVLRVQAVELLDQLRTDHEDAETALEHLCSSPNPMVRLEASAKTRNFENIRRFIRNTALPAAARARAVSLLPTNELGKLRGTDRTMLVDLAQSETFEVLEAILRTFVRTGFDPDLELLKNSVNRCGDKGRLAAVRLVGRQGHDQHDWLIQVLSPRYPLASSAVVQMLGASKSPKAGAALQRVIEEPRFGPEVLRTARAALGQLRTDLGALGGGLAVFEPSDGQVSLVEGEAGTLSRPPRTPSKQGN